MHRQGDVEPLWTARLKWRMRGAWLWPTFALLTLADGFLLAALPPYDGAPPSMLPGVLLAGFANLFCVALPAPLTARWLRRRRPDLPRPVAENYAGTALLCALAALLIVAGVAHRPAAAAQQADRRAELGAVQHYVISQAPAYRSGLSRVDSIQLEPEMYRTCVPGPDPKRWLCLFVETDQQPPGVRLDSDKAPNSAYRSAGGFR